MKLFKENELLYYIFSKSCCIFGLTKSNISRFLKISLYEGLRHTQNGEGVKNTRKQCSPYWYLPAYDSGTTKYTHRRSKLRTLRCVSPSKKKFSIPSTFLIWIWEFPRDSSSDPRPKTFVERRETKKKRGGEKKVLFWRYSQSRKRKGECPDSGNFGVSVRERRNSS